MARLDEDDEFYDAALAMTSDDEAWAMFTRTPTYELETLEGTMTAEVIPHPTTAQIEQSFSLDNLTAANRDALVIHLARNHVGVAQGDSIELEDLMQRAGMTAVALWHSCRDTTVVPLMIAAAALRHVTRLPDDPRLDPKPHGRAPVKAPRNADEASRRRASPTRSAAAEGDYLVALKPNPKRAGSAAFERYELYELGLTRDSLRDRGITTSDFKNDLEKGFIAWGDAWPVLETEEPLEGINDTEGQADDDVI